MKILDFIYDFFCAMFSCTDDECLLVQNKEDVNVDEVPVDTTKKILSFRGNF
ncbi:MAG: hypothetical protein ACLU4J_25255 [Butyricimonas paravirosa]